MVRFVMKAFPGAPRGRGALLADGATGGPTGAVTATPAVAAALSPPASARHQITNLEPSPLTR